MSELVKYSREWKVQRLKESKRILVNAKNKMLMFIVTGDKLSIKIGTNEKEYEVKNITETLYALADEKPYLEVYISNPDSYSRSIVYVIDMRISPSLW